MQDLTQFGTDVFYKVIYKNKQNALDFIMSNDYEAYAKQLQTRYKMNPEQWEFILNEWEQKEEILSSY